MIEIEVVRARGHELVRATHRTTFEITRERTLTPRGDCIIGVEADKGALHLSQAFKRIVCSDAARVIILLTCGGVVDVVEARGSSALTLSDPNSIVVRRSSYVDARTVAVQSNKAAVDLSRELVEQLKQGRELEARFLVFTIDEEREARLKLRELLKLL